MRFAKIRCNSIVFKISMIVAMMLVTVMALLVSYNVYSFSVMSRNTREQQQRVMNVHSRQIRTALSSATTTLDELALDNPGNINTLPNITMFRRYRAP